MYFEPNRWLYENVLMFIIKNERKQKGQGLNRPIYCGLSFALTI